MTNPVLMPCPVCGAEAQRIGEMPATDTRATLAGLFGADVPDSVAIADYGLDECTVCGLVYADPMVAGDGAFYGWITGFERYHAGQRWEWGVIKDQARTHGAKRLLEVGAGMGKLMDYLGDVPELSCVGIDVSASSVLAAQARGLDVREAAFADLDSVLGPNETFDAIVMSHVLEHVEDPLGVTQTLIKRLKPGGRLMAAVPYSPMSREMTGWDIMNLPPHHLTRWHAKSLTTLGDVLGAKTELFAAKAKSPLKRAVQDTCGQVTGDKHPAALKRLGVVLGNFGVFQDYLSRHKARETVNGQPAGDSVLAVYSK